MADGQFWAVGKQINRKRIYQKVKTCLIIEGDNLRSGSPGEMRTVVGRAELDSNRIYATEEVLMMVHRFCATAKRTHENCNTELRSNGPYSIGILIDSTFGPAFLVVSHNSTRGPERMSVRWSVGRYVTLL